MSSRRRTIFSGLIVALLLAVTLAMTALSANELAGRERAQVARGADAAATAIEARLRAYIEVLYGARGLFAVGDGVSHAEFHRFATGLRLDARYPGIQVLGAARPVAAGSRTAAARSVAADIRASGLPYPAFAIHPEGAGPAYPISYIEPQLGNRAALGLDFRSEPRRRAALERTLTSGAPAATAPVRLVQETGRQQGFLIFLAGGRRGEVVYAAFRMGDLMEGVLGKGAEIASIEVYDAGPADGPAPSRATLTYDGDGRPEALGGPPDGAIARTLEVAGRDWSVVYRPPSPLSPWERAAPWTIGGAGALLTLLVAGLMRAHASSRRRALALAERMSADARASEARFRAIVEQAPDAMLIVDHAGTILRVNRQLERIFGHRREDLVGQRMELLLPAGLRELHERHRAAYAASPKPRAMGSGMELRGCRANGEEFPIDVSLSPLRTEPGRTLVAASIRDASERRELERAKDEFIAIASHELRTPLTSILGYTEMLLDDLEARGADEPRRLAQVVHRNAERLRRLVGDVLLVAQSDAGRLALTTAPVDLGDLVSESVVAARAAAVGAGIDLRVAEHDAEAVTLGDRARLGQVLDNLISNALKFTPAGGTVTARVGADGDRAVIEVADTGSGIPAEEQLRLFERFYRASGAQRDAVPGTGLGLAICRTILEAHHGTIGVTSAPGIGTTFRVELPLAASDSAVREPALQAARPE
jgi:PAS domain S-box-containing protein